MKYRSNEIEEPSKGTCEWLLKNSKFEEWNSHGRGMICIKGKPGAGKSTLIKYARAKTSPAKPSFDILFFFHDRGSSLQKTSLGLFRSLLHQLLERFPHALSDLVKEFNYKRGQTDASRERLTWNEKELPALFETSLAKVLEESAVRMFIDALDEFGQDEARKLVEHFTRWNNTHNTYDLAPHNLSICFSCRHVPVVVRSGICPEIWVEDENQHDIHRYVHDRLSWDVCDSMEQDQLDELRRCIKYKSNGVFQWVSLVVKAITWMHEEGHNTRQLLKEMAKVPKDLVTLYGTITNRLESKDVSLKFFQWI
jgi:hypothetical protein